MVGRYIWYSEEGPGRAEVLPSPLIAVPNVTAHPSTVSVPTSHYSTWHCNCLCAMLASLLYINVAVVAVFQSQKSGGRPNLFRQPLKS